jgi:hypothetical protein
MKTPGTGSNVHPDEFATAFPSPNPQKITNQAFKDLFQRNLGWDITVAVYQTLPTCGEKPLDSSGCFSKFVFTIPPLKIKKQSCKKNQNLGRIC